MDIPLPEESQPPGLPDGQFSTEFPHCDNIPLPSCGIQFDPSYPPPPLSHAPMSIVPPVLPPEVPSLQITEASSETIDDPNRSGCNLPHYLKIMFRKL